MAETSTNYNSLGTDVQETKQSASANVIVLNEIEDITQKSVHFLQSVKMNEETPADSEGNQETAHYTPGPLPARGISFQSIHLCLEGLMTEGDDDPLSRNRGVFFYQLDEVAKAAVVSHSIGAYISTLETRQLQRIATRIVSDTSLWICRLLRFYDSTAYFHEEVREGLLRVCKMVLHLKYPKLAVEGYEALYSKPPVIYISAAAKPNLGQYLCTQLNLPTSCLNIVPCNTLFGNQYKMDIAALERLLQEDIAAVHTPLLLVASAGSPLAGQVDTLPRLQELCKTHGMWLHLEGFSLAALSLVSVPNLPARTGDSMTLPLGTWLGVPAVPYVTLFKGSDSEAVHAAGLSSLNLHVRLSCLPLWTLLQTLGHDGVLHRIQHCFQLSEYLLTKLEGTSKIRIVGKERLKSKEGQTYSVSEVVSKAVSTTLLFDILVPVVLFQYVPEDEVKPPAATVEAENEVEAKHTLKNPHYFDNLNSWLGQILMRDIPTVKLDIVELDHHGLTVRFSPLESAHAMNTTIEDIDDLYNSLQQQLAILNATVKQKEKFLGLVSNHKNLQLVEISTWAGLGAVRYIPALSVESLHELTDSGKEEINHLNSELVAKLKSTDSAFSLGEGDDGMLCVRFGMVTDDLDTEELVSLVLSNGQEVEESSKYLETMAEMVRLGIEEANKELEKENTEKIMQEGLLRHVPIVGSVLNWWSPLPKETGIKGRSFNLAQGVVQSTENIYKYHMQIHQETHSIGLPPSVSKVVGQPQHSRSSSHSSQHSPPASPAPVQTNQAPVSIEKDQSPEVAIVQTTSEP